MGAVTAAGGGPGTAAVLGLASGGTSSPRGGGYPVAVRVCLEDVVVAEVDVAAFRGAAGASFAVLFLVLFVHGLDACMDACFQDKEAG